MKRAGFLYDDPEKLIKIKPTNEINRRQKEAIKLVTNNAKNIIRFGSWTYKSQLYPGDIDLIQEETYVGDVKSATKKFVKLFQKIVHKIIHSKGYYLADIKSGFDTLFLIDIGQAVFSKTGFSKIVGYNAKKIKLELYKLYKNKYMKKTELDKLFKLIPDKITQAEHEVLFNALREKWLLRWTGKEVLQGYKVLSKNRIKTLSETINEPTMTKVDMMTSINGAFLEVSNVLLFFWQDKIGRHQMNYMESASNYVESLKGAIQELSFSKTKSNPAKLLKRMWAFARLLKDFNMIKILTKIMQTDIGRIYQFKSELEVIIYLLENVKSPPITNILNSINNLKWRIGNIFEIDINAEKLIHHIDLMMKRIKNSKVDKRYLIRNLESINKFFKQILKDESHRILVKKGLFPPPPNYLP